MIGTALQSSGDSHFHGEIPDLYHRRLGPLFFEPYAADLAKRVAGLHPRNVLEVAAGTGIVTRRLLDVLPRDSRIVATDLNEGMLDVARHRIGHDRRLSWQQADAMNLPFEDGEFDVVVCQFGLMFFPDKPQGMHEFRRVLAKGGTLLLNVWDSLEHNPLGNIPHTTVAEFFSENPPQFWNTPFGCHDVRAIRRLARAAGFTSIQVETVALEGTSPSADEAAEGLVRGTPIANSIFERAPGKVDHIVRRTSERLAREFGERPLRVPMQAHILTAK